MVSQFTMMPDLVSHISDEHVSINDSNLMSVTGKNVAEAANLSRPNTSWSTISEFTPEKNPSRALFPAVGNCLLGLKT